MYVVCCVLSGRSICDELITRPDESYRLWRVGVCDLETSLYEEAIAIAGLQSQRDKQTMQLLIARIYFVCACREIRMFAWQIWLILHRTHNLMHRQYKIIYTDAPISSSYFRFLSNPVSLLCFFVRKPSNPSLHFVSYMIQYTFFHIFLKGMVLPLYCWGVSDMIHSNGRHWEVNKHVSYVIHIHIM
jgi:hypothetical protein